MEIKNGIIIDGVLHEADGEELECSKCSLQNQCQDIDDDLCSLMYYKSFVNRGKVKVEKEKIE